MGVEWWEFKRGYCLTNSNFERRVLTWMLNSGFPTVGDEGRVLNGGC